jgi:nicotinamidase-related amidase
MSSPILRISAAETSVVVVDVQDKLLALISQSSTLLVNLTFLLDAAKLLSVPVLATEQYPKGLGPTTATVAERLPRPIPEKTSFSCFGTAVFTRQLANTGRTTALVTGIETHVCVMQTALDLLDRDFRVAIPIDAVAARGAIDHDAALHRLDRAGALLTTSEAVVFEWLGSSSSPEFKAASVLVRERSRRMRELSSAGATP